MAIGALIEITGRLQREVLERLALAAYGSALHEPNALAVPRALRPRVEAMLDRAVDRFGVDGPGVFFLDPEDDLALEAARAADLVIASSLHFRLRLEARAIPHHSPEEGLRILGSRAWPEAPSPPPDDSQEAGGAASRLGWGAHAPTHGKTNRGQTT